MKKYLMMAILLISVSCFSACGSDKDEAQLSTADQVMVNIGQDMKDQAGEIVDASQKVVYSSYEEVYNDYSKKLSDTYLSLEKELKKEIEDGSDTNTLSKSCADKVSKLSAISQEASKTMSNMSGIDPTAGDYTVWKDKINALYMAYEQQLNDMYSKAAK